MGTGGGEFLSSLKPFPKKVIATEAYEPNVKVAQERLIPLGIDVVPIEEGNQENSKLPFNDSFFDLIINRHDFYDSKEIFRILKPNGHFVTQQVGNRDFEKLNTIFGTLIEEDEQFEWKLNTAVKFLINSGLEIIEKKESIANSRFYDIRAIVYFLKVLDWSFPNFSIKKDLSKLENIYVLIKRDGFFEEICHRFFIIARKPGNDV